MRELLKEVLGALSKRVPRQKRLIFMVRIPTALQRILLS